MQPIFQDDSQANILGPLSLGKRNEGAESQRWDHHMCLSSIAPSSLLASPPEPGALSSGPQEVCHVGIHVFKGSEQHGEGLVVGGIQKFL